MDFTKEKIDFYLMDTSIENMFINEYMPLADGNYVKVYLFALMYADKHNTLSNDTIAKHLNMEVEDVLKAWSYWEKQGVIRKRYKSDNNRFDYVVEFISLKQLFVKGNNNTLSTKESEKQYSPKDIEIAMRNDDIKEMFHQIQCLVGRSYEGNEMFEILEWLESYKMDPRLIIQAYSYCVNKKNNNSFKYIAKVVRNWHDNNVKTVQDLEKYLEETDIRYSMYRRILKSLGLSFRYPTEEEKRIIDTWFDEWKFDLDTILEACKKTSGISNPNINYINSILRNWHQKNNVTSPANTASSTSNNKGDKRSPRNILEEYEKIRNENEQIQEKRRFEIYGKIPRIKIIDEEVSKASISISKAVLMSTSDSTNTVKSLKSMINQLNQEKAFLLTENNYPADYLDMIYQCELCKDTGFLSSGEKCSCFHKKTNE